VRQDNALSHEYALVARLAPEITLSRALHG